MKFNKSNTTSVLKVKILKYFGLMLTFVLILSLFAPSSAQAEAVNFTDANLEAVVREVLNKPVGDITDTDMITLTTLTAENKGIANLEGLEYASNLSYLNLNNNQISDISPLSSLANLTQLFLDNNQLSNIAPLTNLTNLTRLYIRNNQIIDVTSLANLNNLTVVYLESNQIANISALANLNNLNILSLGSNQISDISPLQNLTNVSNLNLYDNKISSIEPLNNLKSLTALSLGGNQISDISILKNFTELNYLTLRWNQISDITPLQNLTNLTQLTLDNNQISDTTPLIGLINLTELYLYNNQISDITPLVLNSGLGVGDYIDLRNNYIDILAGSEDMNDVNTLITRSALVIYIPQYNIIPSNLPLILNGSFEIDADSNSIPDIWTSSNFVTGDGRSADYYKEGDYSLKIISNHKKVKNVIQRIKVGGNSGDTLNLSGWNKNVGTTDTGKRIRAFIYLNNTDGTRTSASIRFNTSPHDWLKSSINVTADKSYSSIDIRIFNANRTGTAYFDDFRLVKTLIDNN